MNSLKEAHLVLFLTAGASLQYWHKVGFLSREAELYQRLLPHVGRISWVTYGGVSDLQYQDVIPGIHILYNRWRLPIQVYIQQLPWLHRAAFQSATLLKSEQTGGVEAALRTAEFFGKRLIARSGFSLALFAQYEPQAYEENYDSILALEKKSFSAAQQIVVTTEEMRDTALKTHHLSPEKIRVIPNYINTERFAPPEKPTQRDRPLILFVGRLTYQKNVENLLTAVAPLKNVDVEIVGSGTLYDTLVQRIRDENLSHVKLIGNVPNAELPQKFRQAAIYVQPSRYEGHPKTIFEAMSSGLPVIAGNAPGIRQFIRHQETGWLCEENPDSIRAGIEALLANAEMRQTIGQAARRYVVENFSLDQVVALELAMLDHVLNLPAPTPQPTSRPILKSIWTYGQRVAVVARRKLARA